MPSRAHFIRGRAKEILSRAIQTLENRPIRHMFQGITKDQLYYWRYIKQQHNRNHGGYRWKKFDAIQERIIRVIIWAVAKSNPTTTVNEYIKVVRERTNLSISASYVKRIFYSWKWSWKKPERRQIQKYTVGNILYYAHFVSWITGLPSWQNLKFIDESTFHPRGLFSITSKVLGLRRKRGISRRGVPCIVVDRGSLREKKINLMAMIQIDNPDVPIVCNLVDGNSNGEKFLEFVTSLCQNGHIKPGDIVILDNASYHRSSEIEEDLEDIQEEYQFTFKYLPTYSPELNPIELIFAFLKNTLRATLDESRPFIIQFLLVVAKVTQDLVFSLYHHCFRTRILRG